jgi:hypothetical protein
MRLLMLSALVFAPQLGFAAAVATAEVTAATNRRP